MEPIKADDLYQYLLYCEYKKYLAQMEQRRRMAKIHAKKFGKKG